MSQTAYTQDPAVAIEGMLADTSSAQDLVTGIASESISFGRGVGRTTGGPADDRPPRVELVDTTGKVTAATFMGVSRADTSKEQATTPIGYAVNETVSIVQKGRVWVNAEDAAALGDAAFVRFAAGTFANLGAFRTDADTATAVALPNASFRSITTGANQLAIVQLEGHI